MGSRAGSGSGVEAGENVVTMVPNSFESYFVWLGVAWLRAIEVPTNNMYLGEMLRYLITNSEARFAVISERVSWTASSTSHPSSSGSRR